MFRNMKSMHDMRWHMESTRLLVKEPSAERTVEGRPSLSHFAERLGDKQLLPILTTSGFMDGRMSGDTVVLPHHELVGVAGGGGRVPISRKVWARGNSCPS